MFLKRMFYAAASILLLVTAYHVVASDAGAQIQNTVWFANRADASVGVVIGRTIRWMDTSAPTAGVTGVLPPVPGTAEIVAFCVGNHSGTATEGTAVLADGSVWVLSISAPAWVPVGNRLTGATPTATTSFGALKAKYR